MTLLLNLCLSWGATLCFMNRGWPGNSYLNASDDVSNHAPKKALILAQSFSSLAMCNTHVCCFKKGQPDCCCDCDYDSVRIGRRLELCTLSLSMRLNCCDSNCIWPLIERVSACMRHFCLK